MRRTSSIILLLWSTIAWGQSPAETFAPWLQEYQTAFAAGDSAALGKLWAADAVWTDANGVKVVGREAIQGDLATFFAENPGAKLVGSIDEAKELAPGVLAIEGKTQVVAASPVASLSEPQPVTFSAIAVKQQDKWVLSRVHELPVVQPSSPKQALSELEFLVGTWQDDMTEATVTTQVRWSDSEAFLIRSFTIQVADNAPLRGTEIIGWDPTNQQIRSWRFDSDGSFGSGTWSRDGDSWLGRMQQTFVDGGQASSLQVVRSVDPDTLEVATVGLEIDGIPQPASDPVRVKRVSVSATDEGNVK
jgi:uncharacterized protein (TIGR02246 family)